MPKQRKRTRAPRPDGQPRAERPRGSVAAYLRTIYVVLISIVVISVVAEILFREVDMVDRFAPNIATESMGILLVVLFVQRYLERQERAQRLRASIGGLRKASRALQRMAEAWAQLVKATLPREPESPPRELGELLETHYTEELAHCDPAVARNRPGETPQKWVQWASREVAESCSLLNQIIIAYSGALDPAYVEVIDELVDDPFIHLFADLAGREPEGRAWTVSMNTGRALRETHFARLMAAINLHNSLARDAAAVRTRRMAPRTGTIGMELPLDHDLRVNIQIQRRWWSDPPALGSLRTGPGR
jgi:hypothetical protein